MIGFDWVVSLVRDRVLETLRLMASELKSDVSTHSTNPAYLTYIMDYIIFYCVCQEVFLFFCSLGFTANHTSYLFGLSFDTETGIHLLLDSSGARCQNRTALLVPKTRVLPLHFILHINGAPCRNRTHFWCLQNNCSNHWANGAYILYEPYVHSAFIE